MLVHLCLYPSLLLIEYYVQKERECDEKSYLSTEQPTLRKSILRRQVESESYISESVLLLEDSIYPLKSS